MPAVDRHLPFRNALEATQGAGGTSPALGPEENLAWESPQATLQARRLLGLRWVAVVAMAVMAWAGTRLVGVGLPETSLYLTAAVLAAGNAAVLKPSELAQRVERDPSLYETGVKMEAKVVPGTIKRDAASQTIQFSVSDGLKTIPVTYRGLAPDTFTDAQEIEVVVEGRLSKDGVFHATTLLAKCGSRYEAQYKEEGKQA